MTKRQQQGAESRKHILDVAESLMAKRGVAGTSISALTKESGLPASSIYWHFGSKDGVLIAVIERGAQRFFASLADPDSFAGKTGAGRIRAQLNDTARAFELHGDFLGLLLTLLLLHQAGSDPAGETIARVRGEARVRIAAMLDAAAERRGSRRRPHPLTGIVMAAIDGIFIAHVEDPGIGFATRFGELSRMIEASIAPAG